MRDRSPGRFYLKGVLHPDDADRAVRLGVDAVVVSNDGGRQLDHALASLDALPASPGRWVGAPRSCSTEASGVGPTSSKGCASRPRRVHRQTLLHGLAVNGATGVRSVLAILRQEMRRAMTLMGAASLDDLGPQWLVREAGHDRPDSVDQRGGGSPPLHSPVR